MAEVPFAVDGRGVVFLFADLGQRHLAGVDAMLCAGAKRAKDADAHIVATGEQPRARGTTDGLGYVKVGELAALLGHAVEVRCGVCGGSERADISVTHVIHENDNDVGRSLGGGNLSR